MPADDGLRLHDHERLDPPRPDARERDPEGAIDGNEKRSLPLPAQNGKLLSQGEILGDEARPRSEGRAERRASRPSAEVLFTITGPTPTFW
jgi:hypothetical protein